jgi:hypothetical protein
MLFEVLNVPKPIQKMSVLGHFDYDISVLKKLAESQYTGFWNHGIALPSFETNIS